MTCGTLRMHRSDTYLARLRWSSLARHAHLRQQPPSPRPLRADPTRLWMTPPCAERARLPCKLEYSPRLCVLPCRGVERAEGKSPERGPASLPRRFPSPRQQPCPPQPPPSRRRLAARLSPRPDRISRLRSSSRLSSSPSRSTPPFAALPRPILSLSRAGTAQTS